MDQPAASNDQPNRRFLVGCLVAAVIAVVLAGVGGYMLYRSAVRSFIEAVQTQVAPQIKRDIDASNLPEPQKAAAKAAVDRVVLDLTEGRISVWDQRTWADPVRGAAKDFVAALDLPAEQKTGLAVQIDRLADGVLDGSITEAALNEIGDRIANGPLGATAAVWGLKVQHVYGSALDEAGKADAERQLERVARGVVEGRITLEQVEAASEPYSEPHPETGQMQLKQTLTETELRGLIDAMRKLADEHEIPDEPYEVDYAGELRRAIDAGTGVTQKAEAEAPVR